MTDWKIPLFQPDLTPEDVRKACEPIEEEWLTMGERTQAFEKAFAETIGVRNAIAVTNGTAALHLSLIGAGVLPGDEVILPSLTFVACANAIVCLGAKPVFADCVSEDDWTISPEDVQNKITERTKAVMAVHYAGFPCQMEKLLPLVSERGLTLIEDCAHAIVSSRNDAFCGSFGDAAAFSFFSNKNMTTGEGGMVIAKSEATDERLRKLRSHGMTSLTLDRHKGRAISYDVVEPGYNYRIDEIRSALGHSQLQRLTTNLEKRKLVYDCYNERLREVEELRVPFGGRVTDRVGYHIYPILLSDRIDRNEFIQMMKEDGIQTSIHYPAIHQFSAYESLRERTACPLTDRICAGEVTLPFYPAMTENDVDLVCDSIKRNLIRK